MAFQNYMTEDDLKKDANGQPIQASQQSTALPTSGGDAGVGANGAAPQQTAKGSGSGSGWTNLQTYLGANAGQGAATTDKLLDPKQQQIDTAVNSLNTEVNSTKNQVQSNTIQRNEKLENDIKNNPVTAKNEFVSYTGQTYNGPTTYAPSSGVQKNYVGIQPEVNMKGLTDPKTIGTTLKDDRYTFGMGALDGYLVNSEGGAQVASYNDKNKNVIADKDKAITDINAAIVGARTTSNQNVGFAKKAAEDAYQEWLNKGKGSTGQAVTDANARARQEITDKYKAAGFDAPTTFDDSVSANGDFSWVDSIDPATLAALNALAEIDGNDSTNAISKGSNSAVNVDWNKINSDITGKQKAISDEAERQRVIKEEADRRERERKEQKDKKTTVEEILFPTKMEDVGNVVEAAVTDPVGATRQVTEHPELLNPITTTQTIANAANNFAKKKLKF